MTFEAYKVAVKLSLINHVTSGLVGISHDLMNTNRHINGVNAGLLTMENRLASIKRLSLVGVGMAVTGVGMLSSLKGPIEHAMEWERDVAKLRQMGVGDAQIRDAQKFVQANDIIGTSMQQRMRLFAEAQGSFRQSGMDGAKALEAAKTMTPILAQYETASKLLSGPHQGAVVGAMRNLNKTIEIMGGIGDTKLAEEIANGVFKAVQSSGKMVDERNLKQFVAYGSSATNSLSIRSIFGGLEPAIGEYGGSTTATGLRTAFTRMMGGLALPPKKMQTTLSELGIGQLDHGKVRMKDWLLRLMQSDTEGFTKEIMGIYKAHGIVGQLDRERTNAILFNTTGAKIYNKVMQQMPVIEESLKAYDKARGIAETNRDNANGPMMAIEKFHAAMSDLGLVVGQTVLPALTPMITGLSGLVKGLQEYPVLLKGLTIGFVGLAGAMAIGGALALTTAGFKAVGMALTLGKAGTLAGSLSATAIGLKAVGLAAGTFLALYAGYKLGEVAANGINGSIQKHSGGATSSMRDWLDQSWLGNITRKYDAKGRDLGGWFSFGKDEPMHFVRADVSGKPGSLTDSDQLGFGKGGAFNYNGQTGNSGSQFVASKSQQPVQVTTQINMDGRRVAQVVSHHQGKEASRPFSGISGFDYSQAAPPVGLGYQR